MTTEFVQIGNIAFNPAQIVNIDFGNDKVWIDFVAGGPEGTDSCAVFGGASARAFKEWWNKKASVWYEDPECYEEEERCNG